MNDVDEQLTKDLYRLARALVPDDALDDADLPRAIHASPSVADDSHLEARPDIDELRVIEIGRARPPRRRLVSAAAVLLVVAASGAGIIIDTNRHDAPPVNGVSSPSAAIPIADNVPWTDGVTMMVYVQPGATQFDIDAIREVLVAASDIVDVDKLTYLDPEQSLAQARVVLADDPGGAALLNIDNVPTSFNVVPRPGHQNDLRTLTASLEVLAGVQRVSFVDDAVAPNTGPPSSAGPDTSAVTNGTAVQQPTVEPAPVLVIGDSIAGEITPHLDELLTDARPSNVSSDVKVSSGLVRSDYFDWFARAESILPAADPDVVIAMFGSNDGQPFVGSDDSVDSAAWRAAYGERVGAMMDLLGGDGRHVIWVGVANSAEPSLAASLAIQNDVARGEAATRPFVQFIDAWQQFSNADGTGATSVIDPATGILTPIRNQIDRFRLNDAGLQLLAESISSAVAEDLG